MTGVPVRSRHLVSTARWRPERDQRGPHDEPSRRVSDVGEWTAGHEAEDRVAGGSCHTIRLASTPRPSANQLVRLFISAPLSLSACLSPWLSNRKRRRNRRRGLSRSGEVPSLPEPVPKSSLRKTLREEQLLPESRTTTWVETTSGTTALDVAQVRVIDPPVCPDCGAEVRAIAFIIDLQVVDRILTHLRRIQPERERVPPGDRA